MQTDNLMTSGLKKRPIRRNRAKAASVDNELVNTAVFFDDSELLLEITPKYRGVDLVEWSKSQWPMLEQKLLKHGAILFRGFDLPTDDAFLNYLEHVPYTLIDYVERSSPRQTVGKKVFTSTIYPNDHAIALHNENTASLTFAQKVWFFCQNPATEGGETPIADLRAITASIDDEVLAKFRRLGWLLVRNYGKYLAYDWKDAFAGRSKEEVEQYCLDNEIQWQWLEDGGLRTWQRRSAFVTHKETNDELWFNHIAFWHRANLPPQILQSMLQEVGEQGLPFDIYYGDGSVIEDEVAVALKQAYLDQKKKFLWQQGDIMLIDNMLCCHGREKYQGDRAIRVAMGQAFTREDFAGEGGDDLTQLTEQNK